jgi:hypothetical protein
MDRNKGDKLPNADLTQGIIASALNLLHGLGHGGNQKPYANALVAEFYSPKIPQVH